ncbi:MAG: acetate--CoA ligase family protein [archaeon YNP-LCB-003-016]|jgi:acetyl-CoA synthetase (ADP-forming)|uniref:acetate--CoA ligase family protein n=1 Tax=Candidatus Culexarchaeum yellowstonense TaxID=2928963 RepID=UPI0026ED8AC2|nr:acetate--CoA ligase family protein [Candidatus Culexarchaeum yellowstonense]MCR6690873.1 acetate--CoA ligase family protein [Candidatus Culexarchaeum yellowstonense]
MDAAKIIENALKEGRKYLMEHEAKSICQQYGMSVTRFKVAKDLNEALKYAEEIGYPVVFKIVSPDIIHKSDVGGVIVNIKNEEEAKNAYKKIMENVAKNKPNAKIIGILVQEMAPAGLEVIVGAIKDPQFGHTIMFGLGGIFVEILKDVTFRIAPLTMEDAMEMIREIKGYPLLKGYRGQPPADENAIIDTIMKTSKLLTDFPQISQLDLNPIFVYEKGAKIVDARIILE